MPSQRKSLQERLWPKIEVSLTGCLLWQAHRDHLGYGRFSVYTPKGMRSKLAHRIVYELTRGPIPDGLDLDHLCRVPACVDPRHLEPVTRRENSIRGIGPELTRRRKSLLCERGHRKTIQGGRLQCARCKNDWQRVDRKDKPRPKRTPAQAARERVSSRERMRQRREAFYQQGLNSRGRQVSRAAGHQEG